MAEFINDNKCLDCKKCFSKSPIFSLLSEDELGMMNDARIEVHFKAGEIIYKQGSPLTHIVILNSGLGKIFLEGDKKQNLILTYSKKYEMNGGVGIFIDLRHHSSMMAVIDCGACFIDIHVFKKVMECNPDFMRAYLKEHSERVLHTYQQFSLLTQKNIEGRMAESLLFLSSHVFDNQSIDHISKKDLAELTAMTFESTIRVLKLFKTEVQGSKIIILNEEGLKKISYHA